MLALVTQSRQHRT